MSSFPASPNTNAPPNWAVAFVGPDGRVTPQWWLFLQRLSTLLAGTTTTADDAGTGADELAVLDAFATGGGGGGQTEDQVMAIIAGLQPGQIVKVDESGLQMVVNIREQAQDLRRIDALERMQAYE